MFPKKKLYAHAAGANTLVLSLPLPLVPIPLSLSVCPCRCPCRWCQCLCPCLSSMPLVPKPLSLLLPRPLVPMPLSLSLLMPMIVTTDVVLIIALFFIINGSVSRSYRTKISIFFLRAHLRNLTEFLRAARGGTKKCFSRVWRPKTTFSYLPQAKKPIFDNPPG